MIFTKKFNDLTEKEKINNLLCLALDSLVEHMCEGNTNGKEYEEIFKYIDFIGEKIEG